jgi:hypothetical protein
MSKRKQIAVRYIVLSIATDIALSATGPGHLRIKWKSCGDRKADHTVERIIRALAFKLKRRRVDVREQCRDLVLDILGQAVNRGQSVAPYHGIIDAFTQRNDQTFLRALGRLSERKSVVFDDTEWWLLLHYDSLKDKTDEEILAAYSKNGSITLGMVRARRQRLRLSK